MMTPAQQPELYKITAGDNLTATLADRVFDPVCLLNHKYYLKECTGYYFIVRNDLQDDDPMCQRVCLYLENVTNKYLYGTSEPVTVWLSNELRYRRKIETIYRDMLEKASEHFAIEMNNKKQKQLNKLTH